MLKLDGWSDGSGMNANTRGWHLRDMKVSKAWKLCPSKGRGITVGYFGSSTIDHKGKDTASLPARLFGSVSPQATLRRLDVAEIKGRPQSGIAEPVSAYDILVVSNLGDVEASDWQSVSAQISPQTIVVAEGKFGSSNSGDNSSLIAEELFKQAIFVGGSSPVDAPLRSGHRPGTVSLVAPAEGVELEDIYGRSEDLDGSQNSGIASFFVAGSAALWLARHGKEGLIQSGEQLDTDIPTQFLATVTRTARRPNGWRVDHDGAGILDAEALLRFDPKGLRSDDIRETLSLYGGGKLEQNED